MWAYAVRFSVVCELVREVFFSVQCPCSLLTLSAAFLSVSVHRKAVHVQYAHAKARVPAYCREFTLQVQPGFNPPNQESD